MKIYIYDNSGHPFQVQLSRQLAKYGYEILHQYSISFQTPKGHLEKEKNDPDNFNVSGIDLGEEFQKYSFFKRRIQEKKIGRKVAKNIFEFKPEIVICSNTPINSLIFIQRECEKLNIRFIFWVQDFYGLAIKKIFVKKIGILGILLGNYYINLEKKILERSDHIIVISEEFCSLLANWKVKNINVSVIPNWAPINELEYLPKDNNWSRKYNLNDKFVFLYSGTLGLKHNPVYLIKLSQEFSENSDVRIVVVSEGLGANYLSKKKKELNLSNLLILDFQPYRVFSQVLASGDVLVALLDEEAGVFSIPSKVLSYHCAGRSLLLSVPLINLAAKIVNQNDTGIVVNSGDIYGFLEKARYLYNYPDITHLKSLKARQYALNTFNIEKISYFFQVIFNKVIFLFIINFLL